MSGKGKGILLGFLIAWLIWPKRAKASQPQAEGDLLLSKNFRLSEFLRSFAELRSYLPTQSEIANLRRLVVLLLQPFRDLVGPLLVTNGLRPPGLVVTYKAPDGSLQRGSIDDALTAQGFRPSETSDHKVGLGADIYPQTLTTNTQWLNSYDWFKKNPNTRQVILYYRRNKSGALVPSHLHVAVIAEGYQREPGASFAWVEVDGKRVPDSEVTSLSGW